MRTVADDTLCVYRYYYHNIPILFGGEYFEVSDNMSKEYGFQSV